jgi:hypothetical protein
MEHLSSAGMKGLIHHLLTLEITIPGTGAAKQGITLARAGRSLAQAYALATTRRGYLAATQPQPWWVTAGHPILFWESGPGEELDTRFPSRTVPRDSTKGGALSRADIAADHGVNLPLWLMSVDVKSKRSLPYQQARELRICLLRLHAECECLRIVLQRLASDQVQVASQGRSPGPVGSGCFCALVQLEDDALRVRAAERANGPGKRIGCRAPHAQIGVAVRLQQHGHGCADHPACVCPRTCTRGARHVTSHGPQLRYFVGSAGPSAATSCQHHHGKRVYPAKQFSHRRQ